MKNSMLQDLTDGPAVRGNEQVNSNSWVRFPIQIKITLPYLVLAVGLTIGAVYVVTRLVLSSLEERFTNQLIGSGLLVSESMVRQEIESIETLRLLSHAQGIPEAMRNKDIEELKNISLGIIANAGEEAVEFLDSKGNLILSIHLSQTGDPRDYSFSTAQSIRYSGIPFIKKVINKEVDDKGDKFSGLVREDWTTLFFIAGPVYDDSGRFSGVILVGKTLSTLVRDFFEDTLAQVTLYDSHGNTLASTFITQPKISHELASAILENQDSSRFKRNIGERRTLEISRVEFDEILGPWEVRDGEDLGIIGVALQRSMLVQAFDASDQLRIVTFIAITILLLIAFGINVTNIVTRPIRKLVKASTEVANGNLDIRVEPQGNDEIALLTHSFNTMVSSLNQAKVELLEAYDKTLEGWSLALELRDSETEGHTRRVTRMTLDLAQMMGIAQEEMINLRRGALLHDIGKMAIPDSILLKPGKLTFEEWEVMRRHPVFAYQLISPIRYLHPAMDIPYCHHEKWDGSGYPRGLRHEEIPIAARIFAVVDVWDAMRSNRPYRRALPEDEACEYILSAAGSHFDPLVVEAFFDLIKGRYSAEEQE